jgi:hypothetical protein
MPRAPWACPALTVLVLLSLGKAAAQGAPPADPTTAARTAIAVCISRIDSQPTGLVELEKRCPDLAASLQAAQVRPMIIPSSRDLLDRYSLSQLRRLLHPARGPGPAVSKLTPFLPAEQANTSVPRPWWRRLWDWIVEHLNHRPQDSSNSWLTEMARQLARAQWLWKAIIGSTLISLPLMVVIIVVREVRAMGGRSTDAVGRSGTTATAGAPNSQLTLLRQAPLGQRPARLFALLIARLVAAGRLPPDRSLTHREVARSAVLDGADQRHFLESLARVSERQLYANAATPPDGLEELLARGEDLYTAGWGRPVET